MELTKENIALIAKKLNRLMIQNSILQLPACTYAELCEIQNALGWMLEIPKEKTSCLKTPATV